jgi:hypothetical protein
MLGHLSAPSPLGVTRILHHSLWDMQGRQFVHAYPSLYTHCLGIIYISFQVANQPESNPNSLGLGSRRINIMLAVTNSKKFPPTSFALI